MERNYTEAIHSWARQQAWLLLIFFPFPVGNPVSTGCSYIHVHASCITTMTCGKFLLVLTACCCCFWHCNVLVEICARDSWPFCDSGPLFLAGRNSWAYIHIRPALKFQSHAVPNDDDDEAIALQVVDVFYLHAVMPFLRIQFLNWHSTDWNNEGYECCYGGDMDQIYVLEKRRTTHWRGQIVGLGTLCCFLAGWLNLFNDWGLHSIYGQILPGYFSQLVAPDY